MRQLLLLLLLGSVIAGAAEDPAAPVLRMQSGLATAALRGWPPPREDVQHLVSENFDLAEIARMVLGKSGSAATAAQRERLARALGARMAREIQHRPPPRDAAVVSIRAVGATDWIVTTRSRTDEDAPLILAWHVRAQEGKLRVIDALKDGTSAVITQHDDFVAALRGSDLERVILDLERRNEAN
jgi:ABC-type transporter MlaC component